MGLFSKKYDYIKDNLILKLDLTEKLYFFTLNGKILSFNELNKKTQKYLYSVNEKLRDPSYLAQVIAREEIQEEIVRSKERYDYLFTKGYNPGSFSSLLGVTPRGTMSETVQNVLIPLINSENTLVGIHRLKSGITSAQIEDILLNGLKMVGHLGGTTSQEAELKDHVSYYQSNRFITNELMFADSYKNSIGSILVSIPLDDLDKDIYIKNNGEVRLNPKYIVGYLPLHKNHHLEEIICRDDINKTMMDRINAGELYVMGETINMYQDNSNLKHI